METPSWIKAHSLNDEGLDRIEAAVKAAEERTSGEVVPMLVRRSAINSAAPMLGGIFALLLVLACNHAFSLMDQSDMVGSLIWAPIYIVAAIAGYLLGKTRYVQLKTLPRWDIARQVRIRAMLEFYQGELNHTESHRGILLLLSLEERMAVVLADEAISRHYQHEAFHDVVADLVAGARSSDIAAGFVKAIASSADLLVPHFPASKGRKNELQDRLRIKE